MASATGVKAAASMPHGAGGAERGEALLAQQAEVFAVEHPIHDPGCPAEPPTGFLAGNTPPAPYTGAMDDRRRNGVWAGWRARPVTFVVATSLTVLAVDMVISPERANLLAVLGSSVTSLAGILLLPRRPRWGLATLLLAAIGDMLLSLDFVGPWTLLLPAVLLVVYRGARPWATVLAVAAPFYLALATRESALHSTIAYVALAGFIAAAAAGAALRYHRQAVAAECERADEADRSRELLVEASLADERLRLSQELHDTVGHHIAVANLNLTAAELQLRTDREAAGASLARARQSLADTLRDTQTTLRHLRSDVGPRPLDAATLRTMAEEISTGGLRVAARVPDHLPVLDAVTAAVVHRVVQEALTNVARHGAGHATLLVEPRPGELLVRVANTLAIGAPHVDHDGLYGGHGVRSMGDRVRSVGGHLEAGPSNGTFILTAAFPVAAPAVADHPQDAP